MAIGTIDRTPPPPFFRQGPSALTQLVLCSALSVLLMVADNRFALVVQLRSVIATLLYYPQRALLLPVEAVSQAARYGLGLRQALADEEAARRSLAAEAARALRVEQLQLENAHLRSLLALDPAPTVRAQAAQVLYESADPYSRKVVIDRGAGSRIALGSPVVNENGVLGQVTRVYPLSSEVTLLIDKDAAIPVLNGRTQARSAVFGSAALAGSGGGMEMRFMAGNADVRVGDALSTSGVDGVYPSGLPVARVVSVDRKIDSGFARILLAPSAPPDGVRYVMVFEPIGLQLPPGSGPGPGLGTGPGAEEAKASVPRKGRR